jgi:RHS repeat-associated protein
VEYTTTANDREKYATYTRDSLTGFDYAMNRYYSSQWGRFLSPDPAMSSVRMKNPQSWNRYAYAVDDPVNRSDPSGLGSSPDCGADDVFCIMLADDDGGGGGGADIGPSTVISDDSGNQTVVPDTLPCVSGGCTYTVTPTFDVSLNPAAQTVLGQAGTETQGLPGLIATGTGAAIIGAVGLPALIGAIGTTGTVAAAGTVGVAAAEGPAGQEVANQAVDVGTTVYRVYGGGSTAFGNPSGSYWTTVDPTTVSNYANAAGLPTTNTGQFMITGTINDMTGATTGTAAPIGAMTGGLPEVVVPNAACQITVICVMGLNPPLGPGHP